MLTELALSHFNTSNVAKMSGMFQNCSALSSLDLSSFNTLMVTEMQNMFKGSTQLQNLNISNFSFQKVTDMTSMFEDCNNLITTIKIDSTLINNYSNMFLNATTESGSRITINYINSTSSLVDSMILTKSENSNVLKGTL